MLTYEEALEKLLPHVPEPTVTSLSLQQSLGRVLATPVAADVNVPSFPKSFVDGYAVRSEDVRQAPVQLNVIGVVGAGSSQGSRLGAGQAVQIMTGAPLPVGADAVQMVERTRQLSPSAVEILEPVGMGENIALEASEVKKGSQVLQRGTRIGPVEVGVLASFGQSQVDVYNAPTVAVISTGDELVDIDEKPEFGQIRNSNAFTLWAQCRDLGLEAAMFPVAPDNPERIRSTFREGLKWDLLIFSGGVSMGEYDYVHRVLGDEGVELFFHKAAIKPGKPLLVGRKGDQMIFGLPGNPVSAFVTFELFVRPAVRCWMGFRRLHLQKVSGKLLARVTQRPGRKYFKPASTLWSQTSFQVNPIETKGSADLTGFAAANSLVTIEKDVASLEQGETVEVLLLNRWFEGGEVHEAHTFG